MSNVKDTSNRSAVIETIFESRRAPGNPIDIFDGHSRGVSPEDATKRRRVWIDGQESFVQADEMEMTDEQIRASRNAKFWARKNQEGEEEKRKFRLRAQGFREWEIKKLRFWEEHGTSGPITPSFTRHVFDSAKREPCTKDEAKLFAERMSRIEQLKSDSGGKYGNHQVGRLIAESKKANSEAALRGDANPPKLLSESDAFDCLQHSRLEINKEIVKLYSECRPILDRVRADLIKASEAMADELQGEELELHAKHDGKFGFDYVPSRTLITLRQMAWRVPEELSGGVSRQLLAKLGIKL